MSLVIREKAVTSFEVIPEGVHIARCVSIIDLGTQIVTFDKKEKETPQVRFEFEFPELTFSYIEKETNEEVTGTRVLGINFTASLSSKGKLRKFLESWRGKKFSEEELKGFNLGQVLGKVCQIQVIHSDDGKYANIENALPLMKGVRVPESLRELISFSILSDEKGKAIGFDEEVFEKFSDFLQNKIMQSKEMKELTGYKTIDEKEAELNRETKKNNIGTKEAEAVFNGDDEFNSDEIINEEPKSTNVAREKSKTQTTNDDFFGEE